MAVCDTNCQKFAEAGKKKLEKTVHIHIAVDTGMTRIGYADNEESARGGSPLPNLANLEIEGLFHSFCEGR